MTTAAFHRSIDQQQDDRTDHRPDHTGGLHGTVLDVRPEEDVTEEAADEAAQHAEQPGLPQRHRIPAGHEQSRQGAGDQSDDQQDDDEPQHGVSSSDALSTKLYPP